MNKAIKNQKSSGSGGLTLYGLITVSESIEMDFYLFLKVGVCTYLKHQLTYNAGGMETVTIIEMYVENTENCKLVKHKSQ